MKLSLIERATWRDYYELCKPNVVWLMMVTAIVGMCMATPGVVPIDIVIFASIGIALCAASAAAINHLADRHIDAVMARTSGRPIVKGKIDSQGAAIFAFSLGCLGMLLLLTRVNPLTAWLTLISLVGYAFVYTFYLKRATSQNIVIGGLAGAMPPLLGWTAITDEVTVHGLLLVLIIFVWTPPHFWGLAIARKDEYAKVDIPMLPVTHGSQYTARQCFLYTVVLFPVALLPVVTGLSSWIYMIGAMVLGGMFIRRALILLRTMENKDAMKLFSFSIMYLLLIFPLMLLDHYLLPIPFMS
ncbi:heme o synthase [Luminiphilus sp. nBUS_16]|uniref:heme o synthase n=1 Tax=Luminiphilus sp. nBUS_16 TaxID=3395315 RepID=UPI003EBB9007